MKDFIKLYMRFTKTILIGSLIGSFTFFGCSYTYIYILSKLNKNLYINNMALTITYNGESASINLRGWFIMLCTFLGSIVYMKLPKLKKTKKTSEV